MVRRVQESPSRPPPRHGAARVLSKLGLASRSEAARWIHDGRVALAGKPVRDPEQPVPRDGAGLTVDGRAVRAVSRVYLALNKPRGLVTTRNDEQGRATIYDCLQDTDLPWVAPVGRLDRASEGLLLLSNDPEWAAAVTDPERGPDKRYHVQLRPAPEAGAERAFVDGVEVDGRRLAAVAARCLRRGERGGWLELTLDEGRNRHIRRLAEALGYEVRRLVRVAIGGLELGDLPKGAWRLLSPAEVAALAPAAAPLSRRSGPAGGRRG